MKRKMRYTYVILRIVLFLIAGYMTAVSFCPLSSVKAYTEAEKKQAKAWLSAHGYPPTKEGAYQAYSDYMSGKLKLSEAEQNLANPNLGKPNNSKKKATKDKTKKKKTAKKKPGKENGTEANSTEKKEQPKASPISSPVSTVTSSAVVREPDSNRQEMEKDRAEELTSGGNNGRYFIIVGGALLLILVLVLAKMRRTAFHN